MIDITREPGIIWDRVERVFVINNTEDNRTIVRNVKVIYKSKIYQVKQADIVKKYIRLMVGDEIGRVVK